MDDLLRLAEKCEAADEASQGRLLEEAWEAMAEHSSAFRRFATSFVRGFDNQAGKFAMALEACAYESAAMMLVPEGDEHWPQIAFIGRNPNDPEKDKFRAEIWIKGKRGALRSNANSLALAITAASLRARASIGKGE